MKIYIDNTEILEETLQVEGVNTDDFPKFCDAFFSYGETVSGRMLTADELDRLTNEYPELVNSMAYESLI